MSRPRFLSAGTSSQGPGYGTGFPFPYSTGDVTFLPQVTIQKCAKWWGRVKTWQVSTGWAVTVGLTTYQWTNGTMTRTAFVPANELDLLSAGETSHQAAGTPSGGSLFFSPMVDAGQGKLLTSSGNFFPNVTIDNSSLGAGGNTAIMSFTDFAPSDGTFNVMIDGVTQLAYYQLSGTAIASPATITLTPKEYWTYDGIYDATTGAVNPGFSPLD